MKEILLDTFIDAIKLLPFLFVAFLIIEFIEHKIKGKNKTKIENSGKYGPIIGSILGAFPQCGFSVMATNLYATRIITLGTLISIYLSTSDEMLPIMLSEKVDIKFVFCIILIKVIVGMISGIVIDMVLKKKKAFSTTEINHFCKEEHCHCKEGIVKSAVKHTISIAIFIMIITLVLNIGIHYLGEENIAKIFLKDSIFSPFIASLVGLIPNCGASVIVTELYLNNIISISSLLAGLLTGSGVSLLILFRTNKNLKENLKILFMVYGIGVFVGVIAEIISLIV